MNSFRKIISITRRIRNAIWSYATIARRILLLRSGFKHKTNARRNDGTKEGLRVKCMTVKTGKTSPEIKYELLNVYEGRCTVTKRAYGTTRTEKNVLKIKSYNDRVNKTPANLAQSPALTTVARLRNDRRLIESVKERCNDEKQSAAGRKKVKKIHKPYPKELNSPCANTGRLSYVMLFSVCFVLFYLLFFLENRRREGTDKHGRVVHTGFRDENKLFKAENPWAPEVVLAREAAESTTDAATESETKPKASETEVGL